MRGSCGTAKKQGLFGVLLAATASAISSCGGGAAPPRPHDSVLIVATTAPSAFLDGGGDSTASAPAPAPLPYQERLANIEAQLRPDTDLSETIMERLLDDVDKIADEGATEAVARLLLTGAELHPRLRLELAVVLGRLGDVRAVPALSWALQTDVTLSDAEKLQTSRLHAYEHVRAASALADVVMLHPERREEIARAGEGAVIAWIEASSPPRSHGMPLLALLGGARGRAKLRAWADPVVPLPKPGGPEESEMPAAFGTARSALRALGIAHRVARIQDPDVHALFLRQLARRPARLSLATGKSELATSVGALATGAAWGLSEMQDPMAWEALLRYAEDEKNSESARLEAAHALGWVGNAQELLTLARRLSDPQARSASKEQVRMGLLGAFMQRPSSAAAPAALLPLISKRASAELRFAAAEAIGNAGQPMDETLKKSLRGMLVDPDLFAPAGLALILGGDPESAAAACKVVEPRAPKDVNRALERSIAFISMRDLEEGHLGRLVKNARACGGYPDRNARSFLRWRDRGDPIQDPHAVTPAVLRGWLSRTARSPSSDAIKREDARMLLDEMQ